MCRIPVRINGVGTIGNEEEGIEAGRQAGPLERAHVSVRFGDTRDCSRYQFSPENVEQD